MALLKNIKGEYNYQFNWVDVKGNYVGFNDVWAANKKEAIKKAKEMETHARWCVYDPEVGKYVEVENKVDNGQHCFYNEGMYLDVKSMRKATREKADEMNRLGWMLSC